jgi:predicted alpha/beta hydrolase family esterase
MKTTLEGMGYLVIVPKFPSPAGQSYESWKVVIKNYIATFDAETIIVGHGAGGLFALRLLQDSNTKIRGLFLVATYGGAIGNIGYDRINKTFYEPALDWQKIIDRTTIVRIYAGADDPFVPKSATEELADNLGEIVHTIPEGGHINKAAGFSELVVVASGIKESLTELDRSISIEHSPDEPISPNDIHSIKDAGELIAGKPLSSPTPPDPSAVATDLPTEKIDAAPEIGSGQVPVGDTPVIHPHTMYQDLSKIVQSNRGKVASSLLTKARVEKAEQEATSPASGQNIIYTILSIIILGLTIGIIIYLIQKYAPAPVISPAPEVISLVRAEEHEPISFSTEPSFIIDQKIKNLFEKPLTDGTIRDIYYVTNGARASFTSLLTVLGVTDTPAGLTSEFPESTNGLPVFMHGLYTKNQVSQHFLVVRVTNYDNAFSLMKLWEPLMARHLGPLMNISSDFLRTRLVKDTFTEELINNKPVRTLRYQSTATIAFDDTGENNSEVVPITTQASNAFANAIAPYQPGDLILAYFFLNEKTIVITNNLDLIPELLRRYSDRQIYQ